MVRRGGWGFAAGFALGCLAGCLSGEKEPDSLPPGSGSPAEEDSPVLSGDSGADGGADAGSFDAGSDAGRDAGSDAGRDAWVDGGGDAGFDAGYVPLPVPQPGWQFFGPQHGGPRRAFGVSADQSGNLWVAGGPDGLFLLAPGQARFRRFTRADGLGGYTDSNGLHGYSVISVAGGPAQTVFVGYKGLHGGRDEADPEYMVKSGDADQVLLDGVGLQIRHFDLSTPPGVSSTYPQGRDKIRDVFRILFEPATGDLWFGGNHGIALYQAERNHVYEHHHAAINGYTAAGSYTLLSGDWYGLARDPAGDIWMGGGHRLARLNFASEGGTWYADLDPIIDVWPDAVPEGAHPEERTDDFIQDLAAMRDGSVWVASIPNSLARVSDAGVEYLSTGLLDRKITALEADPRDDSLWVGHIWGGLTRFGGGARTTYDYRVLGISVANAEVLDIQSQGAGGTRRILIAFGNGVIAVYSGE